MTDGMPPGFEPWPSRAGDDFLSHNGPLYRRFEGGFTLGFRVEKRHCNPGGTCHGGMLSFLADMLLIGGSHAALNFHDFTRTISLHCDYLDAAPMGAWLEGRMEVVRATRTLIFGEGRLTIAGKPVLRVDGILRRPTQR
ncbi:PaaI family thioesterase [Falsiroseomonas sp. HW251]|uniref:PaaI family thioesterase n=1 Tax=Falsiroseomonas sp. HW251 TaxID=3390998 RepID=UPI003D31F80D